MKVLVVGGGGREHALCWKLNASPKVSEVLCAPGNAGTLKVARNVAIGVDEHEQLVQLCRSERVDLVLIGPEDPLVAGLADAVRAAGILCFGPGADGARLEGSKVFTKELLERHRIPTAGWRRFDRAGAAKAYLEQCTQWPQVVKADGLAAGKGVFICDAVEEASRVVDSLMEERALGEAGSEVVIEECLIGDEVSIHAITDGSTLLVLDAVMDHKQVGDGDTGPNTGGMGVTSPVPALNGRLLRQIEQRVLLPTLHALRTDGISFRGVLFVGLMITEAGPRVLEFNCRFGDPEIQAIVRRMKGDLAPILLATARGELKDQTAPEWSQDPCVGVVVASDGYPGRYTTGHRISGLEAAEQVDEVVVFHAGTRGAADDVRTDGGRVLCVTALGHDSEAARLRAYEGVSRIGWEGMFCRSDIGLRRRKAVVTEEQGASYDG